MRDANWNYLFIIDRTYNLSFVLNLYFMKYEENLYFDGSDLDKKL